MGRTENLPVLTLAMGPNLFVGEGFPAVKEPFPILSKADE